MTEKEAIKMLKSKMDGHTDTSYEWAETVRMAIKALEQEPKRGHWINNKCTNCGYVVQPWNNTNHCPNCGTKMIEPQESEDKSEQYSICEKCDYDYDSHSGECYDCVKTGK